MSNESGQYQLSVLLRLQDQLSGGLTGKTLPALRKFRTESKSALDQYTKLQRALGKPLPTSSVDKYMGKMKAATKETRAFSTEQGKLSRRFSQPISTAGIDAQIGKLRQYRKVLRATGKESDGLRTSMRGGMPAGRAPGRAAPRGTRAARPYTLGNRLGDAGDFMMATQQVGNVWRGQIDSLEQYTDAATRLIRSEARLKLLGLRADEVATGFAAISKTGKEIKTVSRLDLTEGFTDLYQALGDVNQAAKAMPSAAKYMTNFRAFFGDQFGREGANEQLRATFKALEYSGFTQRGEAEMDKMMQEYIRITASTGGRVTPTEVLTMLRRGKVATRGLSVEGLRNVSSLIEDYSAPTTGTALMSLHQNLVSGQVSNPAAAQFQKYGLIKPGGMTFSKAGLPKRIKPGGNILGELLQEDPMKAATVLLEHLRKGGVDVNDEKKLAQEMSVMFPNRNAFAIMDSFITQRKQIEKEATRMGVSADTYQQSKLLSIDPELKKLGQIEEYKAQMENLKVALGQNLLPLATNLMGVLTPVSQFFNQYPTVAKYGSYLLLASKAGSGLLQTFSIYKQSSTLNFLRRAQMDAAGLGGAMSNAEKRAIGLKGKLSSAAGTFGFVLKVAVYGVALERLFQLFSEMKEAREAWNNVGISSGEFGVSLGKDISDSRARKKDLESKGVAVPDYLQDSYSAKRLLEQAGNTIGVLDRREDFFTHAIGAIGEFVTGKNAPNEFYRGNLKNILQTGTVDEGVKAFSGRANELNNPEFMGAFRAKVFARKDVTPEMAYKSDVILQKLNPLAFAQSHVETIKMTAALGVEMGTAQKSIQAISPPAMDTATALYNLHIPASILPQDFNSTSVAVRNFRSAVESINVSPPQPSGVAGNSLMGLGGWISPPKAEKGGLIKQTGLAIVHQGENVLTAKTTQALRDNLPLRDSLQSSHSSSQNHYNITLNVSGDVKDTERLSDEIVSKLEAKIAAIDRKTNSASHFNRLGVRTLEIGKERA